MRVVPNRVGIDSDTGGNDQLVCLVESIGADRPDDAERAVIRQRFGDPSNATFGTQNTELAFDRTTGNLSTRFEANTGLREFFEYDNIDRLLLHRTENTGVPAANRTVTVRYNAIGNILWKSDVGLYTYNGYTQSRPHAVQAAGGLNYVYDANGNVESANGGVTRTHVWTSFNLPQSMRVVGSVTRDMAWGYSAERQRIRAVITQGNKAVKNTRQMMMQFGQTQW